jgi:hypothetical protein
MELEKTIYSDYDHDDDDDDNEWAQDNQSGIIKI